MQEIVLYCIIVSYLIILPGYNIFVFFICSMSPCCIFFFCFHVAPPQPAGLSLHHRVGPQLHSGANHHVRRRPALVQVWGASQAELPRARHLLRQHHPGRLQQPGPDHHHCHHQQVPGCTWWVSLQTHVRMSSAPPASPMLFCLCSIQELQHCSRGALLHRCPGGRVCLHRLPGLQVSGHRRPNTLRHVGFKLQLPFFVCRKWSKMAVVIYRTHMDKQCSSE